MKWWIDFWNILVKDMRSYYLKPPNVSWGLIFPLAWTGMFFIKSGSGLESVLSILPGVVVVSIIFGTTSMLSVTVTFEKKGRSFDRLLLAPIRLEVLMLAKTSGAILFGAANACIPIILASFLTDLSQVAWVLLSLLFFSSRWPPPFWGSSSQFRLARFLKPRPFPTSSASQ
jgi:ABC-2 type transport system permease protein